MNMPSGEDDPNPPLSLKRYAEALAFVREYPLVDRAEVLARLNVDPAELSAAATYWSRRIAEALSKNDATAVVELARAYGVAERYARVERPPVARLKSRVTDAAPAQRAVRIRELVPLPHPAAALVAPASLESVADRLLPTYLRADGQQMANEASQQESHADASAQVPRAPVAAAELDAEATAELDAAQVVAALRERGILPFAKDAPAVPPPASPPQDQSGETQFLERPDINPVVAARGFQAVDASAHLPIPLERFAQIQAALTRSRDHEGVLRHFGFQANAWHAVAGRVASALTASASLRTRYEDLYRQAMQA